VTAGLSKEVVLGRQRNGLGPVGGAQLGEDRRHVELDGPLGDAQGPRDLLRGQALGEQRVRRLQCNVAVVERSLQRS